MKSIRRITAGLLAVMLILSLTGCSFGAGSQVPQDEKERLLSILNDLSANMHPGTAGSSLTSVRIAADLVAWAATTKMDRKEAMTVVAEWLKEQSPELRAAFQEKITSVSESYGRIIKDGASDLLASAGIEKDLSNLGSRLKEMVEAVLASGGLD